MRGQECCSVLRCVAVCCSVLQCGENGRERARARVIEGLRTWLLSGSGRRE